MTTLHATLDALRLVARSHRGGIDKSRPAAAEVYDGWAKEAFPAGAVSAVELRSLMDEFHLYSDGLGIGPYFRLCDAAEIHWYDDAGQLLTVHNWGTGDFDCLACVEGPYPRGSIVYCCHDPEMRMPVARSFAEWVMGLCIEWIAYGDITHPQDVAETDRERYCAYRMPEAWRV